MRTPSQANNPPQVPYNETWRSTGQLLHTSEKLRIGHEGPTNRRGNAGPKRLLREERLRAPGSQRSASMPWPCKRRDGANRNARAPTHPGHEEGGRGEARRRRRAGQRRETAARSERASWASTAESKPVISESGIGSPMRKKNTATDGKRMEEAEERTTPLLERCGWQLFFDERPGHSFLWQDAAGLNQKPLPRTPPPRGATDRREARDRPPTTTTTTTTTTTRRRNDHADDGGDREGARERPEETGEGERAGEKEKRRKGRRGEGTTPTPPGRAAPQGVVCDWSQMAASHKDGTRMDPDRDNDHSEKLHATLASPSVLATNCSSQACPTNVAETPAREKGKKSGRRLRRTNPAPLGQTDAARTRLATILGANQGGEARTHATLGARRNKKKWRQAGSGVSRGGGGGRGGGRRGWTATGTHCQRVSNTAAAWRCP